MTTTSKPVVHHSIAKALAALTPALTALEDGPGGHFALTDGSRISVERWDDAKLMLADAKAGEITWEKVKKAFCGVMRFAYHDRYEHNPHGPGCGDDLDRHMRDVFTDPDTEKLDADALRAFGEALDLWNSAWDSLNVGMQRMNLANRIRAYLRNNADATITLGKVTGRFGISYQPSKRRAKKAG